MNELRFVKEETFGETPAQATFKALDFNLPLKREVTEIHPDTFRSAVISAVYRHLTASGRIECPCCGAGIIFEIDAKEGDHEPHPTQGT